MAYCNAGPAAAAAYIVEKVSGQKFEDFVEQNLFFPIGMKTATYFKPTTGKETTLYHGDGKTPYEYWNIIFRPAGSIGSGEAFGGISKSIRNYITLKLQKPPVPAAAALPANAGEYAGWYEPDSPRTSMTAFIEHLAGLSRVRMENGKLLITNLGTKDETFIPVEGMQFRYVPKKDAPEPVATLALLQPKPEGRFIQAGGAVR